MRKAFSVPFAGLVGVAAVWASSVAAQPADASGGPRLRKPRALVQAPGVANDLSVPAADFSHLRPVLSAAKGRHGRRRPSL